MPMVFQESYEEFIERHGGGRGEGLIKVGHGLEPLQRSKTAVPTACKCKKVLCPCVLLSLSPRTEDARSTGPCQFQAQRFLKGH